MDFNEDEMKKFWLWFADKQAKNIFEIVKEMGERLQQICGADENTAWYELGYDSRKRYGVLDFWCETKHCKKVWKRLIELAPKEVLDYWKLNIM